MEVLEKKNSVTHQLYAQDLVITAVICFIGGIGFTLLIGLIYYKVSLRKNLTEGTMEKAGEENSTMANLPDISEWRNHTHMDNSLVFDQEVMTLDPRTYDPVYQLDSSDKNNQFWYSNCCSKDHRGIRQNLMRWDNRTITQLKTDEETQRRRVRVITEHDLRMLATQQGILEFTNKLSHGRTSSHPRKEAVGRRVEVLVNSQEEGHCYKAEGGECSKINKSLYSNSCHRLYRPSEPNLRKGRVDAKIENSGLFSDFPCQHREIDIDLNIGDKSDTSKDIHIRRKARNVTFNLERLRNSSQQSEDERKFRDEEREGNNPKVQLRRLKGKVNLNQKSKVHPKRKSEQGHLCRSRSKKSKGKRVTREDRGKTKESHQKRKKSAKLKGLAEDGNEQNERMGEKTEKTSMMGPSVPESTATDQCAKETAQSVDNTNSVDQLPSDYQHLQNGCIQNYSAPPNLPTSADNGLSLQRGSFLHNIVTTESSSLFAGSTNTILPSKAINVSSITPIGAPGTFNGQEHVLPSTGFLPASILQQYSVYTCPLLDTQEKDFMIPTVDSNAFQQSLPPPPAGSSPIVEKLQSDSTTVPGPQPQSGKWEALCRAPAIRQSVESENGDRPDLTESLPLRGSGGIMQQGEGKSDSSNTMSMHTVLSEDTDDEAAKVLLQQQVCLSEEGSSTLKRKLRLVLPEKTSSRPFTALEKKIR
ncbi:uncharacterized protein lrrc53 [Takifugu rubripes]|uniref:uncharacterized protein lrrc53 n=1 Tax=Takifugu rubripes TaxID=31033 RepID=UPI001145BFB4|nr:uncharacterized protein LOC115248062 [Takifugu rubripes]